MSKDFQFNVLAISYVPTDLSAFSSNPASPVQGSTITVKVKLTRASNGAALPGLNVNFAYQKPGDTLWTWLGGFQTDTSGYATSSSFAGSVVGTWTVRCSYDGGDPTGTPGEYYAGCEEILINEETLDAPLIVG